jgi:methylglutaconyl-CoA hydratase
VIRSSIENGVGHIVLDRPDKRNAMTPEMLGAFVQAAADMGRAGSCRVVIVRGEGEAFCAGFDLSLCRDDHAVLGELLRGLSEAVRALRQIEVPVVIAAHGAAIAGGCALLGGGDIIVTDAAAKLGYPVVRLGISPAVSAPTLRLLTGDGVARERMLDSGLIDGRRAVEIGLAHECVDTREQACERAEAIARDLAVKPRCGLAATKTLMNELDGLDDGRMMQHALDVSLSLVGGMEERERLTAMWSRESRTETKESR